MDDDRVLVDAARRGDERAVDELLRHHYRGLYGLCRRFARNDADAQDLAQDAVIAILRGLPGFDGRSSFKTWAFRVTTNTCLMDARRRSRRPALAPEDAQSTEPVSPSPLPDDVAATRLDVDAVLASLSDEHRAAVVLRDVVGLEYAEIAEVLDVPVGTVRSRIARGRAAVARQLRDAEHDEQGNQNGLDGIEGER